MTSGCSAVRLAHLLWEQGVAGSNPATPTRSEKKHKEMISGCSAVRLAHLLWEQGVVGSNPATPTNKQNALLAQLVEQLTLNQWV